MEENKGRKEKIYEGIYKMAGGIQDDKDRFPLFNRVKQDHDIKVYIEEQNKSIAGGRC